MTLHRATQEAVERAGLVETYRSDAYTRMSIDLIDGLVRSMIQALDEEGLDAQPRLRGRVIRRVLDVALPSKAETAERIAMQERMVDLIMNSTRPIHMHVTSPQEGTQHELPTD